MSLQFNPPDWVIQDYIARQNQNPIATSLNQVAGQYLEFDQNNRRNRELANESKRRDSEVAMKGAEYARNTGDTSFLPPNVQAGLANPRAIGPITESGQLPAEEDTITRSREFFKKYPQGFKGASLENTSDFIPQLDASGAVIGMTKVDRPRFGRTLPPTKPQSEGDGRKLDLSQERNDLRKNNQARDYAKMFDSDMDVKKATTEFTQSTRAMKMLAEGNPVADQAIRVVAARASGEVGNLAQAEQEVYGGSPALTTWLKRNAVRITEGKLDEQDREYLNQLFTVYKNYGQQRLKQRHEYHAQRFSQNTGTPIEQARTGIGDLSILGVGSDGVGIPSNQSGPYSDAEKESRYQAWKAQQVKK